MDSLICLFVHLALLSTSFGSQETQQCPLDTPCVILVGNNIRNGNIQQRYWSHACTCGDGVRCPVEWGEDPEKTVRLYLHTNNAVRAIVIEMKFCYQVQSRAMCSPNQVAVSLKGYSVLPHQLKNINCRCPGNAPLHVQKVWFERFMERHQNFVCSIPTCEVNQRVSCSHLGQYETTYICECPESFRCVISPSSTQGFCEPISS
ncbi:uncharacterized protein LOC121384180 [Gigantopelta aegis]|uniref:uncharacterized protein LOC121384180 n=1 Tax=Gigantopelta aegis TaxID=1735272 RepID=UPI001B88ADE5|nr:uncharacterized protein LOC121384180 [Gigantopelta aegis]